MGYRNRSLLNLLVFKLGKISSLVCQSLRKEKIAKEEVELLLELGDLNARFPALFCAWSYRSREGTARAISQMTTSLR